MPSFVCIDCMPKCMCTFKDYIGKGISFYLVTI